MLALGPTDSDCNRLAAVVSKTFVCRVPQGGLKTVQVMVTENQDAQLFAPILGRFVFFFAEFIRITRFRQGKFSGIM